MASSIYKMRNVIIKDLGKDTLSFLFKKFFSIFPYHLIAFIFCFFQIIIYKQYNIVEIINYFIDTIPHILFLQMSGVYFENPNYVTWYISAMFIAMFVLFPLCRKYYSSFIKIIAPVCCIFILGQLVYNFDALTGVTKWTMFGYRGLIRAFVEISMGTISFEIARYLTNIRLSNVAKIVLKTIEVFCYFSVVIYMLLTFSTHYEIFALFALFIAITITFSNVVSTGVMNNKISYFLGRISLPIYLSQVFAMRFVVYYLPNLNDIYKVIITIIIDFLLSPIVLILGNILKSWMLKIRNNIERKDKTNDDKFLENKIIL